MIQHFHWGGGDKNKRYREERENMSVIKAPYILNSVHRCCNGMKVSST